MKEKPHTRHQTVQIHKNEETCIRIKLFKNETIQLHVYSENEYLKSWHTLQVDRHSREVTSTS